MLLVELRDPHFVLSGDITAASSQITHFDVSQSQFHFSGTQMMNITSRPPSQMSGIHPKSASSIPRLPPLSRAVSLATGMAAIDPRDEKLGELERIISNYQEKLDAVTNNYQV